MALRFLFYMDMKLSELMMCTRLVQLKAIYQVFWVVAETEVTLGTDDMSYKDL